MADNKHFKGCKTYKIIYDYQAAHPAPSDCSNNHQGHDKYKQIFCNLALRPGFSALGLHLIINRFRDDVRLRYIYQGPKRVYSLWHGGKGSDVVQILFSMPGMRPNLHLNHNNFKELLFYGVRDAA